MSTDAMAVVIGVAVGVAASVPTSLLLVALLRKERMTYRPDERHDASPQQPNMMQPNIIVLDPSQFGAGKSQYQTPLPPPEFSPDGGVRRPRVVGSDDQWNGKGRDW
jgi:hypothetical protein